MSKSLSTLMIACALGTSLAACMVNGKPLLSLHGASSNVEDPPVARESAARPVPARAASKAPTIAETGTEPVKGRSPHAGYPWCTAIPKQEQPDFKQLENEEDFLDSMGSIIVILCEQVPANSDQHRRAESMRQRWMKRLRMSEDDFAREIPPWSSESVAKAKDTQFGYAWTRSSAAELAKLGDDGMSIVFAGTCSLELGTIQEAAVCQDVITGFSFEAAAHELGKVKPERALVQRFLLDRLEPQLARARKELDAKFSGAKDKANLERVKQAMADFAKTEAARRPYAELMTGERVDTDAAIFKNCKTTATARLRDALAKTSLHAVDLVHATGALYREIDPALAWADPDIRVASWYLARCSEADLGGVYKAWTERAGVLEAEGPHAMALATVNAITHAGDVSMPSVSDNASDARWSQVASMRVKGDSYVLSFVDMGKHVRHDCESWIDTEKIDRVVNGEVKYVQRCASRPAKVVDDTPPSITIPKSLAAGVAMGRFVMGTDGVAPVVWADRKEPPIAALGVLLKP